MSVSLRPIAIDDTLDESSEQLFPDTGVRHRSPPKPRARKKRTTARGSRGPVTTKPKRTKSTPMAETTATTRPRTHDEALADQITTVLVGLGHDAGLRKIESAAHETIHLLTLCHDRKTTPTGHEAAEDHATALGMVSMGRELGISLHDDHSPQMFHRAAACAEYFESCIAPADPRAHLGLHYAARVAQLLMCSSEYGNRRTFEPLSPLLISIARSTSAATGDNCALECFCAELGINVPDEQLAARVAARAAGAVS